MGEIAAAVQRSVRVHERRTNREIEIQAIKATGRLCQIPDQDFRDEPRLKPTLPRVVWLDKCKEFDREFEEKHGNLQRRPNRKHRAARAA